jgi:hypothetical protein
MGIVIGNKLDPQSYSERTKLHTTRVDKGIEALASGVVMGCDGLRIPDSIRNCRLVLIVLIIRFYSTLSHAWVLGADLRKLKWHFLAHFCPFWHLLAPCFVAAQGTYRKKLKSGKLKTEMRKAQSNADCGGQWPGRDCPENYRVALMMYS